MRINRSTLLFIVACIIVTIAALVFLNTPAFAPNGGSTATPAVTARVFPDLTAENLARIAIKDTIAEAEIVFIKQPDGNWKVDNADSAITGELNQASVAEAADNLAQAAAETFPAEDTSAFGLEAPAYTVSFTTDAGDVNTLQLGNKNPAGNAYYALLNDDTETVYLLNNASRLTTLSALAAKPPYIPTATPTPVPVLQAPGTIFPNWTGMDVNRFEIRNNKDDEVIIFVLGEDGAWSVAEATHAESLPLIQELVQFIVANFGNVSVTAVLDDADLEPLGLDDPVYTITGFTAGATTYTLQIGATDVSGKLYYALVNDIPQVALVQKAEIDTLVGIITEPPYMPEATPEATAEATGEATAEATDAAD
jgi:hypothetical protein